MKNKKEKSYKIYTHFTQVSNCQSKHPVPTKENNAM